MSVTKYRTRSIRWLFAELLVIVLGILIAIQVEEWRQYRLDRKSERDVLASIQRDVDDILEQYVQLQEHLRVSMDATTILIVGIGTGDLSESDIVHARKDIGLTYLLSEAPTSFEGFLQSGAIGLVQDGSLVTDFRRFFGSQRSWILGLNEVHIQRSREVFDLLDIDFQSVPLEDYAANMSSRKQLVVPVADFPTSVRLQSELIGINSFRQSILEALDGVINSGQDIGSRIEAHLSVN